MGSVELPSAAIGSSEVLEPGRDRDRMKAASSRGEVASDHLEPGPIRGADGDSDFELAFDDLPFAEDDLDGLTLDDEADPVAGDRT
jgi:hypothetical protein